MSEAQILSAIKRLQHVPEARQERYRVFTPSHIPIEEYLRTVSKCAYYDVIEVVTAEKTTYTLLFYDSKNKLIKGKSKCEFRISESTFYVKRD